MGERYKYLGVDGSGLVWGHANKPVWHTSGFYRVDGRFCAIRNGPEWAKPGTLWERANPWCSGIYLTIHEDLCAWGGYWWNKIAVRGVPVDTLDIKQVSKDLLGAKAWSGGNNEAVDHPSHYTAYPLEVIDIIKLCLDEIDRRGVEMSSFQKSCFKDEIKYRFRAGLKGGDEKIVEDINKAMKYREFREGAE